MWYFTLPQLYKMCAGG